MVLVLVSDPSVAVMTDEPDATAVTRPVEETVALAGVAEVYVAALVRLEPLLSTTDSWRVAPTARVAVAGEAVIDVAGAANPASA